MKKIQEEFHVTDYMARKSKEIVQDKGVLSTPNPKAGHSLSAETVKLVTDFYNSEDISRTLPGKKDVVSVKQHDGKRVHVIPPSVCGLWPHLLWPDEYKLGDCAPAHTRTHTPHTLTPHTLTHSHKHTLTTVLDRSFS